jgi:dTDP-4-dehydrorhamnose 3,5-epimerase
MVEGIVDLPDGVRLTPLRMNHDPRGWVAEIFRAEWGVSHPPCQLNATFSQPNALRGAHLHLRHQDYFTVVKGRMSLGLLDLRPKSQTHRKSAVVELTDALLTGVTVPKGVLHGIYSHDASVYIYAVDLYYDPTDELGCRWDDPALGVAWPCTDPILSERDRNAGSLAELEQVLRQSKVEFG